MYTFSENSSRIAFPQIFLFLEKKLHRRPGLYFLTDPKNIETKKSWIIFREDEIFKIMIENFQKNPENL